MKTRFTFIFILLSLTLSNAQVLVDETFNYSSSSLLTEPSWVNTLSSNSGATGTIGTLVNEPLSYGDANGMYALSNLGKGVISDYTSGGSDFKVVKSFTPSIFSGVVYMSLLFTPNGVAQAQSNSEIMCLSIAGSNGPKVLVGKGSADITKFRFATTRASSSSSDYRFATTEYSDLNQTFLLVVKYDFTVSPHRASLFVNPVIGSASEPVADAYEEGSTKDVTAAIDGYRFRTTGSSVTKFKVSGVRISTSWAAAIGKQVAGLSTPSAGTSTNVTNNSFTANWTPVANALSYDISVYTGTTLVKTVTVLGQASSSTTITGLKSQTSYTFTVTANADKINFGNSLPSPASQAFTTTGLISPVLSATTNLSASGFTANWTPVASATGYDLYLYLNTTAVDTITISGGTTSTYTLTNLLMGTSYNYKLVAKGDGATNLDSTPSDLASCITTSTAVSTITTDFGNKAIWGTPIPAPSTNLPVTGSYPTWKANGFTFQNVVIYAGATTGVNGETHNNVASFDKLTTAAIVTPQISSMAQIEFHAYSGSDAKVIALEESADGLNNWTPVGAGTYTTNKLEATYTENLSRTTPTYFRIRNNGTTSMNVTQVIVRQTVLAAPLSAPTGIGAATGIAPGAFTASWTPVANATGYIVSVWNWGKPTNKNFTVVGGSLSSYNVIGLDSASYCTYKVAAVGDGVTNSNSVLSAASTVFQLQAGLINSIPSNSIERNIYTAGKTIMVTTPGYVEIYSTQGSLLYKASVENSISTALPAGIYVARLKTNDGTTITKKISIQ